MKIVILLTVSLLLSCTGSESNHRAANNSKKPATQGDDSLMIKHSEDQPSNSNIDIKSHTDQAKKTSLHLFKNSDGSWGYDIQRANQTIIHQPVIPAIKGAKGFPTEKLAQTVGTMALKKIEAGIMPPTLTKVEINKVLDRHSNSH